MVNASSPVLRERSDISWSARRSALRQFCPGRRTLQLMLVGIGVTAILAGNQRERPLPHALQGQLATTPANKFTASEAVITGLESPAGTAPLPPIGPAADVARVINASIPFAAQGASPSLPFLASGGLTDRERAVDCLAATGYYEAGLKPADQRAVMQVVLNRVRHPAFPNSVCGVVFQGSERRTGCQFTFTCDGAMLRRRPSPTAWREARQVALEMLAGRVEPVVGRATHYHTNWVHPAWSGEMQKIAAVDTHLFFRWRGRAGQAQAFNAPYTGAEPHVSKMSWLSLAQRIDLPPASAQPADSVQLVLPETPLRKFENKLSATHEALPDLGHKPEPDVILTTLDPAADPQSFLRLARQSCAGKTTCRYLGWTDPARKAKLLPVSGAAIDAMSFSYIRHGADDPGKARWNCAEFPREDQAQCLRRGS